MNISLKLKNFIEDLKLGTFTGGTAPSSRDGAVYYATVDFEETRRVLQSLDLKPDDIFVDIGAGKGRVLCLAAQHKMRRVIGIECSPDLSRVAEQNAKNARGKITPIEIFTMAAEEFDYSDATVLYFFNPFTAPILDAVLGKIHLDRGCEPIRLVFVMESPEQRSVFEKHMWLERYDFRPGGHSIAFYRSPFGKRSACYN